MLGLGCTVDCIQTNLTSMFALAALQKDKIIDTGPTVLPLQRNLNLRVCRARLGSSCRPHPPTHLDPAALGMCKGQEDPGISLIG